MSDTIERPKAKTAAEIYKLKADWLGDPLWDIEDPEGFEDHHDELLAFRIKLKAEGILKGKNRLVDKASELGCPVALVVCLETLESRLACRIEQAEGRLDYLESQVLVGD